MIRLEDIHKTYGAGAARNHVLRGVDMRVDAGEFVALMGASGSGKSTLLNIIGALDQRYDGTAVVAGRELRGLNDRDLSRFRNRTVAYIFQQFHLLAHLPVIDNVMMPAWFDASRGLREDLREKAAATLARVGLGHKERARPGHLSGGEKQRVAIARALFNAPDLLLCDEPTGALDSTTTVKVFDLIARLNAEEGLTVLVVTHEHDIAARCRRTIQVVDGQVVDGAAPRVDVATPGADAEVAP